MAGQLQTAQTAAHAESSAHAHAHTLHGSLRSRLHGELPKSIQRSISIKR